MPDNHLSAAVFRNTRAVEMASNALQDSDLKIRAILRLVSYRMREGGKLNVDEEVEIATLVTECAETMSTGRDENFDAIEESAMGLKKVVDTEVSRATTIARILEATRTVARRDASCKELEKAAQAVFEIANSDERFEPDWLATKNLIEKRGLRVEVKTIGNFSPMVGVTSSAIRQAERRTNIAQGRFVRSVQHISALSNAPPQRR